jgi:hypothetical protein
MMLNAQMFRTTLAMPLPAAVGMKNGPVSAGNMT